MNPLTVGSFDSMDWLVAQETIVFLLGMESCWFGWELHIGKEILEYRDPKDKVGEGNIYSW